MPVDLMQGKARGQYSLHMFMSWLHNLEKNNFDQELAAFKETTVWRVRPASEPAGTVCSMVGRNAHCVPVARAVRLVDCKLLLFV